MSVIFSNEHTLPHCVTDAVQQLDTLLPDAYLIPMVPVAEESPIDIVIVHRSGVYALVVTDWPGLVTGDPAAKKLTVAGMEAPQANPILRVTAQHLALAARIRDAAFASTVFDDPRARFGLMVIPVWLSTASETEIALDMPDEVVYLNLAQVTSMQLNEHATSEFQLHPAEQRRLALGLSGGAMAAPPPVLPEHDRPVPHDSDGPSPDMVVVDAETNQRRQRAYLRPRDRANASGADAPTRRRIVHIPFDPAADEAAVPGAEAEMPQQRDPRPPLGQVVQHGVSRVAQLVDRLEQQAERIVEPQPGRETIAQQQLARLLERELENTLAHMLRQTIARNQYTVHLDPVTYAHNEALIPLAQAELEGYLRDVATARDYLLPGALSVTIVAETGATSGRPRVTSRLDATATPATVAELVLVSSGERFALTSTTTYIGRSRDNDVCLAAADTNRTVSRRHAHIVLADESHWVFDGDGEQPSRWGTHVNGQRLGSEGHMLQDGDEIILGRTQRVNPRRPLSGSLLLRFRRTGEME